MQCQLAIVLYWLFCGHVHLSYKWLEIQSKIFIYLANIKRSEMTLNKDTHVVFDKDRQKIMFQSWRRGEKTCLFFLRTSHPSFCHHGSIKFSIFLYRRLRTQNAWRRWRKISGHKKQTPFLKKKNLKSLHVRVFILGIRSQLIKLNLLRHIMTTNVHPFGNATWWYFYMMPSGHAILMGVEHSKFKKSCIRVITLPFFPP